MTFRKKAGLTQAEVAEAAELSDRTYVDIERGSVNMRIETILKICRALHITPDEILTEDDVIIEQKEEEVFSHLRQCSPRQRKTALLLLSVYFQSLE